MYLIQGLLHFTRTCLQQDNTTVSESQQHGGRRRLCQRLACREEIEGSKQYLFPSW
jgi:hypothetical protein